MSQIPGVVTLRSQKDISTGLQRWLPPHKPFSALLVSRCCFGTLIFAMLLFAPPSSAQDCTSTSTEFTSGNGTVTKPYKITSVCQLQAVNSNLNKHFKLGATINASVTSGWNDGEGFVPIGSDDGPFTGTFKGNENVIRNLFINRPDENMVGLFGRLGSGGKIQGVSLQDVRVTGRDRVGGLAGHSVGPISNSNVSSGTVVGNHKIGGLVGDSAGSISNSDVSSATVVGNHEIGGLVGTSEGSISNSNVSSATVVGNHGIGGLVGASEGSISNSNVLLPSTVVGYHEIGGLVGKVENGALSGCKSAATVQLAAAETEENEKRYIGGLVGRVATATVSHCSATGKLSIASGQQPPGTLDTIQVVAGGLIGYVDGAIVEDSFATGLVNAGSHLAGGLIGWVKSARILRSYAIGEVRALEIAGGLVGLLDENSSVKDCYAAGNVRELMGGVTDSVAGGLVGELQGRGSIKTSYATGDVTSEEGERTGSFLGKSTYDGTPNVNNTFATGAGDAAIGINDSNQVGEKNYSVSLPAAGSGFVQISLAQLTCPTAPGTVCEGVAPFTNWNPDVWDFGTNQDLPRLTGACSQVSSEFASGNGTTGNPYKITGVCQLQAVNSTLSAHFVLVDDIDAINTFDWNVGKGFVPIGSDARPFTGTFNGNINVISNLFINRPDENTVGLFGKLGSDGKIQNVTLQDVRVTGQEQVGGLVGDSEGSISNSNVLLPSTVVGYHQTGGLVGRHRNGSLSDCKSTAAVQLVTPAPLSELGNRHVHIGGLAGQVSGEKAVVSNCSATGELSMAQGAQGAPGQVPRTFEAAEAAAGGLIGYVDGATVEDSFATGQVNAGSHLAGGLIGWMRTASRTVRSYAIGEVMALEIAGGLVGRQGKLTVVKDCYATGNVKELMGGVRDSAAGGLVGELQGQGSGKINTSYATGDVTSEEGETTGSFLGRSNHVGTQAVDNVFSTGEGDDAIGINFSQPLQGNVYSVSPLPTTASGFVQVRLAQLTCPTAPDTVCEGLAPFTDWDASVWNFGTDQELPVLQPPPPCSQVDSEFASGNGSEGTPYKITSVCQLQAINSNLNKHFVLGTPIDTSITKGWNGGAGSSPKGFVPIGSDARPFTGTFNGNINVISNLFINRPDENIVGLFGKLGSGGEIQNVSLQGVRITGKNQVGGLVGDSEGSISNSNVLLPSTVVGYHEIGGLVGRFRNGSLSGCKSAATVQLAAAKTEEDEKRYIGGLVGRATTATVSSCSATGELSIASGQQVPRTPGMVRTVAGGLVGFAENVTVEDSFATGQVNARTHIAGGLIGWAKTTSMVTRSYAAGEVMALEIAGGLIGLLDEDSSVKDCYATGDVKELMGGVTDNVAGGLVGKLQQGGAIDTSYATGDVTSEEGEPANLVGLALGSGTLPVNNTFTTGKRERFAGTLSSNHVGEKNYSVTTPTAGSSAVQVSLAQLTCPTTPGTVCEGVAPFADWDASVWNFGTDQELPVLPPPPPCTQEESEFASGNGSEETPYEITRVCQLQAVNSNLNKHFLLGTTIVAGDTVNWNAEKGFVPIGSVTTPFTGTFNGNGNVIRNLFINRPDENTVGLFGALAEGGVIRNVALQDVRITGKNRVGGLVGASEGGTVSDSSASGAVTGVTDVGGLAGRIEDSLVRLNYATGNVDAAGRNAGGLAGRIEGSTVSLNYATGNVDAAEGNAGGLAGSIEGSTVRANYASGNVDAAEYAGGLTGFLNAGALVRNCYASGNVMAGDTDYGYAGGLVASMGRTAPFSTVEISFATGQVEGRYAGGLAGLVNSGNTIANSFATGDATTINRDIGSRGGLVGVPRDNFTSIQNYSVSDPENLPGTTLVMLGQLTCPTTPGTVCEGLAPFNNWDASVWDFGSNIQLPRLLRLPHTDRKPLAQIDIGLSTTVIGFSFGDSAVRTSARITLSPPPGVNGVLEVGLTRISGTVDVCSSEITTNCLFLRIDGVESNEIVVSEGSRSFSRVFTLGIRGEIVPSDGVVELYIRLQGFGDAGSENRMTLETRLGNATTENPPGTTDPTLRVRVLLGGATR